MGVEPRASDIETVQVKVVDAGGHSINNLRPEDFVLQVDHADCPIARWTKAVDYFRRSTYILAFQAIGSAPARAHAVEVRLGKQGAEVRGPSSITY